MIQPWKVVSVSDTKGKYYTSVYRHNVVQVYSEQSDNETVKTPEVKIIDVPFIPTEDIDQLRAEYLAKFGKEVPANKKNDIEWIKSKINS